MHVAFVSLGAFGHVNPTLSVATELIRRGVLNNPDGSSLLTDGVFYVEGEYIQDI